VTIFQEIVLSVAISELPHNQTDFRGWDSTVRSAGSFAVGLCFAGPLPDLSVGLSAELVGSPPSWMINGSAPSGVFCRAGICLPFCLILTHSGPPVVRLRGHPIRRTWAHSGRGPQTRSTRGRVPFVLAEPPQRERSVSAFFSSILGEHAERLASCLNWVPSLWAPFPSGPSSTKSPW
jgi:hypothetical protein